MPRFHLTIINPGAELALGAEWVNGANVLMRRNDTTRHSGGWGFATTNVGAYDHYQDIAVPAGAYADVDAGTQVIDFVGWGLLWNGAASTMTIYVKSLDAGLAVLATASHIITTHAVSGPGHELVRFPNEAIPPLTRWLRVGWSGGCAAAQDVWVDDLSLAIDDADVIFAQKVVGYAIIGTVPDEMISTKAVGYAALGPSNALNATKVVAYAVLQRIATLPTQIF